MTEDGTRRREEPFAPDPLTEDSFDRIHGLALAIETCSDVMIGLVDADTARRALPTLIEMQREEVDRLSRNASGRNVAPEEPGR